MTTELLDGLAAGTPDGGGVPAPRFTPSQLADILGEKNHPTSEQAAIISSPLTPRLVIAGAGSGKTATMADRVVWLVANGWARPEEILGVTFTRKAAGELASRIRTKLAALQRIASADDGSYGFPPGLLGADDLEPKVSTYHSYASSIVSDYGLRLGIERDVVLLGTAQSWQLASEIVEAYDGEYEHFTAAKSTLVNAVIQLAGECAEHLQDPAEVRDWVLEQVQRFVELPYVAGARKNPTQAAGELASMLRTRASVADMVVRYQDAKRQRGVLDFGDLVALAAKIAREIPLAAATERARYKVVLLDEFQDTSHAQLVLFSRLFGQGHAVTAVGDPNQSIYGFRGASAGQLFHFVQEFPVRGPVQDGNQASYSVAPTSYLTTAWRNGRHILEAANTIAAPLNKAAAAEGPAGARDTAGSVSVPALVPSPAAVDGSVVIGRFATDEDEAAVIGRDIGRYQRTVFEEEADGTPVPPTMAVLCRRRAQMECLRREFEHQGIPYEIVGLGGLLDTPEIVDLVATLRVLADPGRSDALMRLLAGARWRIGTADLMAFNDWSRFLARRRSNLDAAGSADDDEEASDVVVESDITDAASLVEALDRLPRPGWTSGHGRSLSDAGMERLSTLASELRGLRSFLGDDLTTLLGEVERAMLLDIEVAAKPGISIHQARRNLDAFQDAAAGFLQTSQRIDLLAFLSWLEAAASEEGGLDIAPVETNREAVQLLTVHASKGLEWDVVFVPGLNAGSFPSTRDSRWSSGSAALPWPLRGDRRDLPQWDLDQPDQKGWLDAEKEFKSEVQHHGEAEERRLAYVAYTRAKFVLWASSAAWNGSRSGMAEMSGFLSELAPLTAQPAARAAIHRESVAEEALPQESPLTAILEVARFPYDPLEGPIDPRTGSRLRLAPGRRQSMDQAAAAVRSFMAVPDQLQRPEGLSGAPERWWHEAELLLDRRKLRASSHDVHLPSHISASLFVDLGTDPHAVVTQLRRPVPREPGMSARKGTAFHAWVEEYFATTGVLDLDEAPGSDSHIDQAYGLDQMVEAFKNSEWADRAPAFVEVPVETRIGDVVVRGRIDAVFRDADGHWQLIDWKTGRRPSGRQLASRAVQLAVYRLAWARLKNVPLEDVSAAFYYVAEDALVRPHDLGSAEDLERIVTSALSGQALPAQP
ncbi:ATP-dependent helicase [Paenarthrobacter ilicis]|uniref:DNA 3'-5' helicase n=1 Tax=Paenarthrobacter ilicis TaxID=43665 RepID=A0ABX0TFM6_9MICC|nr:ATP-dependent DNA helicase [Paenarthrobacter ilicis]MBM7793811.1 DNA helicase-2/ATP-dependent DNA helicase PcrA [Paenarthrobacter ilicis]NII99990.1 DNA helicase-2/ATP-dependent DNA helicase PcrA [Paenarthrobacter ilicis]